MHCTINRKYLRYFERNPRNIVNICANIYGISNGFERGLLPWDLSRQEGATKQGPLGCSYFRQWTPLPLELTTTIIYILDFYSQPLKRVTGCLCLLAIRAQRKVMVNLKGEGRFHIGCSRSEPRDHCPGTTRLGPGGRRFKASSGCRETSLQGSKQR